MTLSAETARMREIGARRPRRLFWRALLWSLVFPRARQRILPTVSGSVLIALALGIGMAAYNSANNILFITLSLLLACLILSGVLSWLNLRGVTWRLNLEPPWRVGEDAAVGLELHNAKRVLPTYGLWFELKANDLAPAATGPVEKARPRPLREILAAADRAAARGRLPLATRLNPGGAQRLDWAFRPARRGRLQLQVENVGSLFPFGFLRKSYATDECHELIVWPAPVAYRHAGPVAARAPQGGDRTTRAGSGADLLALRRYAPGDSHRLIHWKASARSRQLLVRQFAAESQEGYALRLTCDTERWPRAEQFELAVGFAATLAEDLFRAGKLQAAGLDDEPVSPIRRVADLEAFLDRLAVVEREEENRKAEGGRRKAEDSAAGSRLPGSSQRSTLSAQLLTKGVPLARRHLITFAPDGPRGVAAYVDGQRTATA